MSTRVMGRCYVTQSSMIPHSLWEMYRSWIQMLQCTKGLTALKQSGICHWLTFLLLFFFSVCAPKLRLLFNNGHVVSIMVGILRLWSGGTLQVKWARSNFRITDKEHRQKTHLLQQSTQMWIPTFILAGSALCLTLRVRGRGRGGGGAGGGFLRGSGGMGFLKVIIVARLCTHQHE